MTLRRTTNRPTDVYRLYNAFGELLYVGVAADAYHRMAAHRREKPWWSEVRRVRVERYANRAAALHVEATAIRDEEPWHNVVPNEARSNDWPRRPRPVEVDEFEVA